MNVRKARLSQLRPGSYFRLDDEVFQMERMSGETAHVIRQQVRRTQISSGPDEFRDTLIGISREERPGSAVVLVEYDGAPGEAAVEPISAPAAAAPITEGSLSSALQQAREVIVPARRLTAKETRIALERKWHLTYGTAAPQDMESLQRLIPSGLKPAEQRRWLLGGLEEAKAAFLKVFNTSWTKEALRSHLESEGLANALEAFGPEERKDITGAIRMLTD